MIINRKNIKRIAAGICCLMLVLCCLPQSVMAADSVETEKESISLTIDYQQENCPMADVTFSIYRVADFNEDMTFTLTEDFRKYPVSLKNLDSNGWKNLAETLAAFVARDQVAATDMGQTGQDGKLQFPIPGKTLKKGLYLAVGEKHTVDNRVYTPEPVLICLPNKDEKNEWVYDVTVVPKYSDDEAASIKVLKVWKDDGNTDKRPQEIEVQLLQDGKVFDEITLDAECSWQYTWDTLTAGHTWQIIEKDIPDGYTVSVTREETTFAVTNTYPGTTSGGSSGPKLPQTGVLWWPVPVLVICGLLFFIIGWVRRRSDER